MHNVLVTGAGGFIGTHLVRWLKGLGYWVRGVDLKEPQWSCSWANHFFIADLRASTFIETITKHMNWVFHLAADMGGMGYLSNAPAEAITNNTLIDANVIRAARRAGVERFFFSSSACVYPEHVQDVGHPILLKEDDAYPAQPDMAYGWAKLHTEHTLRYLHGAGKLDVRIARFHNCYGPEGSWLPDDRRAKAPAELCRKVAIAKLMGNPEVEIWGDGEQRRSFMWIGDCIEGIMRLMKSDFSMPLNIGRSRVVTINELVDIIADIAGVRIVKKYIEGPQGVRSRSSDNSLCKSVLGWEPPTPLEKGLVLTYQWIEERVKQHPELLSS